MNDDDYNFEKEEVAQDEQVKHTKREFTMLIKLKN